MKNPFPTWALVAAVTSTVSLHAVAYTEPVYDFGSIDTYGMFVEQAGSIYQKGTTEYNKALTFSIDTDSVMRVDLYSRGSANRYTAGYLSDAAMGVFDVDHNLLGVASIDPNFTSRECYGGSEYGSCTINLALTLSGPLRAGTYEILVAAVNGGYNYGPEIHIGVTKNEPDILASYASAMIPFSVVPEPSTAACMSLGMLALGGLLRRQRKHQAGTAAARTATH